MWTCFQPEIISDDIDGLQSTETGWYVAQISVQYLCPIFPVELGNQTPEVSKNIRDGSRNGQ